MINNKKSKFMWIGLLCLFVLVFGLAACSAGSGGSTGGDSDASAVTSSDETNDDNSADHESADDYVWDESNVYDIALNGDSITENSDGVTVSGTVATITSAGTYNITGTLDDGQIIVDTGDADTVRLLLSGVDIASATSAPIFVKSAAKVVVVLTEGTTNTLTDASQYVYASVDEDEPNAAIFSKSDLTVYGGGTLTVYGNYNDAIASKDGLIIEDTNVTVHAADDGIRGKDYLVVKGSSITVTSGGDGLKSDNEDDATRGYISIESGDFSITSAGDAITAETDVSIAGGDFNVKAGGGSSYPASSVSAKGVKAGAVVVIDDGTFTLNTADDALHSNGTLAVNGGTFSISTGDDGIHSETSLAIEGGTINITKCYEGIESAAITIDGGNIHLVSSDDGINAADGTAITMGGPMTAGTCSLKINGGYIYVKSTGDGLDINGSIVMTGGTVIVDGPTANDNGAIDYDSTFTISGGLLVAAGSSGMAMAPSSGSTQCSVSVTFSSTLYANTLFNLQTSGGASIVTFVPAKNYRSVVISSPDLAKGSSYKVYYGGSSSGTAADGLYEGGVYTPGTLFSSQFTISSTVTVVR